jgi:hypothetical protein
VVCATVTFGLLPPVRSVLSPVITGSAVLASVPAKVQTTGVPGSGPPVQTTFPVPIAATAWSAFWTAVEFAL